MSQELASDNSSPLSDDARKRLDEVRRGLLKLHKALLDGEKRAYEQLYGRINSGGELLQLVIHHPWFAWLRAISELVVLIDERLEQKDPPTTEQEGAALFEQVRTLLRPAEGSGDEEFQKRYQAALQEDPDNILAHASIIRLLPSSDSPQ